MRLEAGRYVTLVEVLELTVPYEEFSEAVGAAANRLEAEGVRQLVAVHFCGDPGRGTRSRLRPLTVPKVSVRSCRALSAGSWDAFVLASERKCVYYDSSSTTFSYSSG